MGTVIYVLKFLLWFHQHREKIFKRVRERGGRHRHHRTQSYMPRNLRFPDLHSPLCSMSHPQSSSPSEHSPTIPTRPSSSNSSEAFMDTSRLVKTEPRGRHQKKSKMMIHAIALSDQSGSQNSRPSTFGSQSTYNRTLPPLPDADLARKGKSAAKYKRSASFTAPATASEGHPQAHSSCLDFTGNIYMQPYGATGSANKMEGVQNINNSSPATNQIQSPGYQTIDAIRSRKHAAKGFVPVEFNSPPYDNVSSSGSPSGSQSIQPLHINVSDKSGDSHDHHWLHQSAPKLTKIQTRLSPSIPGFHASRYNLSTFQQPTESSTPTSSEGSSSNQGEVTFNEESPFPYIEASTNFILPSPDNRQGSKINLASSSQNLDQAFPVAKLARQRKAQDAKTNFTGGRGNLTRPTSQESLINAESVYQTLHNLANNYGE